jgi:hypothetical protein
VAPVVLSEDDAAALILHGDAKRAWADIEGGAVVVPRDVATAVLLRYSRHVDGVTEPLERLMLLVDKLKADVNAQDAADRATPLHSLFMHPMQVRPPLHLAALIHVSHAIALRGVCVCVCRVGFCCRAAATCWRRTCAGRACCRCAPSTATTG